MANDRFLKAANTGAFVPDVDSSRIKENQVPLRYRPLAEKLMYISFVTQFFLSLVYGVSLFFVNIWHPEVTQWLAQHLSAVTDPVARFLPLARYADRIARPEVGFSATLIRHVFSFLMLVNLVPGVISFWACKEVAVRYGRILNENPRDVKKSAYVFLFLIGSACVFLFVIPIVEGVFNVPLTYMDGISYFVSCMCPTAFFFSVLQVVAIDWAYCMPDRKAEIEK